MSVDNSFSIRYCPACHDVINNVIGPIAGTLQFNFDGPAKALFIRDALSVRQYPLAESSSAPIAACLLTQSPEKGNNGMATFGTDPGDGTYCQFHSNRGFAVFEEEVVGDRKRVSIRVVGEGFPPGSRVIEIRQLLGRDRQRIVGDTVLDVGVVSVPAETGHIHITAVEEDCTIEDFIAQALVIDVDEPGRGENARMSAAGVWGEIVDLRLRSPRES